MRILHVCPRYWPAVGGAERYIQELSERLAREDHDVTVYTTDCFNGEGFFTPEDLERVRTALGGVAAAARA